jgi:hypothetical protein
MCFGTDSCIVLVVHLKYEENGTLTTWRKQLLESIFSDTGSLVGTHIGFS